MVSTEKYELKHNIYNTYNGPRNARYFNSMKVYKILLPCLLPLFVEVLSCMLEFQPELKT